MEPLYYDGRLPDWGEDRPPYVGLRNHAGRSNSEGVAFTERVINPSSLELLSDEDDDDDDEAPGLVDSSLSSIENSPPDHPASSSADAGDPTPLYRPRVTDGSSATRRSRQEGDEEPHPEDPHDEEANIPAGMICPILLQIMRNPVVDPDGHSYDRNAIVEWLRRKSTSPITRQPLRADQLVPNRALEEIIRQYRSEHMLLEGEEEI